MSLAVKVEVWIDTVYPYAVDVVFLASLIYPVTLLDHYDILAVGVSEKQENHLYSCNDSLFLNFDANLSA